MVPNHQPINFHGRFPEMAVTPNHGFNHAMGMPIEKEPTYSMNQ